MSSGAASRLRALHGHLGSPEVGAGPDAGILSPCLPGAKVRVGTELGFGENEVPPTASSDWLEEGAERGGLCSGDALRGWVEGRGALVWAGAGSWSAILRSGSIVFSVNTTDSWG